MSSDPTDITETERPVRNERRVQLQGEIWRMLQRGAAEKRAVQTDAARAQAGERDRFRSVVTDLARSHHQLTVFLARHDDELEQTGLHELGGMLATIHDRYGQVLTRAGAELIYADGQPFTLDLMDSMTITASIPSEGVTHTFVRETVSPGVRIDSELVCKAEVQLATPITTPAADEPGDAADGGPH